MNRLTIINETILFKQKMILKKSDVLISVYKDLL